MAVSSREDAAALIGLFTDASGLSGDRIAIRNALPHFVSEFGPADYFSALSNLGAPLEKAGAVGEDISKSDCPCMFIEQNGAVSAVLDVDGDRQLLLGPGDAAPKWRSARRGGGTVLRFARQQFSAGEEEKFRLSGYFRDFRGHISSLLVVSLITNLAALASPLLVMTIYDRVIPTKSVDAVIALAVAALVAVVLDLSLRLIRGQTVAFIGSEVERDLGLALFGKLISLPISQINRSSMQEQLARIRQFESLRDLFSGPLMATALDLPFVFIFIGVLFYLSQSIGLLLIGVVCVFALATLISMTVQKTLNERSSAAKTAHQSMLFELAEDVSAIQRLGAEDYWQEQLDLSAEEAARTASHAKRAQLVAQSFGQTLMMVAGVGTIAFGAIAAVQGDMTFGVLIALMTLVWRVLGPVQSVYSSIMQIHGFAASAGQVRNVLALEGEFTRDGAETQRKSLSGRIDIANVSHRYDPMQEPVLSGVNLSIKPGQLTVFCGLSGSGRSTLFDLIGRIYTPSTGAIYFDGVDCRQIAVDDLRRAITIERQYPEFLHGTIRQNFELANPVVTDEQISIVLEALGVRAELEALPDGLNTRLDETFQKRLSQSVAKSIGLARCLLRDTRIYLFDHPCSGLDGEREHRFLSCIQAMRGDRTVLLTSDRPSHWELADHLVFLDQGRVLVNEPRASALPKVRALYKNSSEAA